MTITPGTRLGAYEILTLLGSGGMGEVYRARDSKLNRDVALKVLPEAFTLDPDRIARFTREAQVLASLNHPNIGAIYGFEDSHGVQALVLELVDGPTLADRIAQGPIPLDEALPIAKQIAEALEAAHEQGIIHRDLKPANIKLRPDRTVKVLDFGLAKGATGDGMDPDRSQSSTATLGGTREGVILGTAAYMSPEQARGKSVDKRTDIWAFGCVLCELLTAQQAFRGETFSDTIAAILEREPDWKALPPATPPRIRDLLQRCLQKDAQRRVRDFGDARIEIEEALAAKEAGRRYQRATDSRAALETVESGLTAGPKPLTSIAVLPFVFLSEVEERKALSLGFADSLISMLGNLEDMAVAPTSAILNFAPGIEPARVCSDLGVRYTLQGNVQKVGAQWRVSMQLFDSAAQKITFSEKHDLMLENVFDVQDEIGRRTVESLQSRFPVTVPKARDRYSDDTEAYYEFMLGLRESYASNQETLESAIQHLSKAVERDPDFALAHATLSYVSMNMHFTFDPQRTWVEEAEYHCERAITLDPALPEGHLARAWILWSAAKNFQHTDAIAALERVLAVQPNLERAHNRMAGICLHIGRLSEARIAHEQAQRSNPKNWSYNLEKIYLYGGDFARAEEAAEAHIREKRGMTAYVLYGHAIPPLYRGDLDLAEQRLGAALQQLPDEPLIVSLQGMLHARHSQPSAALECVRRALESPRSFGHTHHTSYQVACVYAVLGETDKAMRWLEHSVDTGFACWPFFRIDPHLESLREEPTFQGLVADLERKYTALRIQRL